MCKAHDGVLWMKSTTRASRVSCRDGRSRFPPNLAVRSLFKPTLVNPVTSATRSLPILCRQVNAMEGVCHFNMRVAQEAGMVSGNSARI